MGTEQENKMEKGMLPNLKTGAVEQCRSFEFWLNLVSSLQAYCTRCQSVTIVVKLGLKVAEAFASL